MYSSTPVGEISIVSSPIKQEVNVEISGLTNLTTTQQTNIQTALSNLLINDATPLGTTIYITSITAAIQAQVGTETFTLSSPTANITTTLGYLATLGTVTYSS